MKKKSYNERKMHCALCGELKSSIPVEEIVGKSYKELTELVEKYNKKYGLNILITGGGFGFELSSYNLKEVKLFREELKKISIIKYYVVSYIEGLDWYANFIWKRNF